MNQIRIDTDLEVTSLNQNVETVREKLDDGMNEHMSVVQRQKGFLRKRTLEQVILR
jgi:hypothetical protein